MLVFPNYKVVYDDSGSIKNLIPEGGITLRDFYIAGLLTSVSNRGVAFTNLRSTLEALDEFMVSSEFLQK